MPLTQDMQHTTLSLYYKQYHDSTTFYIVNILKNKDLFDSFILNYDYSICRNIPHQS